MPTYTGNLRFSLEVIDTVGAVAVVNLVDTSGVVVLCWPVVMIPKGDSLNLGTVTVTTHSNDPAGWQRPSPGTIHRSSTSAVAVNPPPQT